MIKKTSSVATPVLSALSPSTEGSGTKTTRWALTVPIIVILVALSNLCMPVIGRPSPPDNKRRLE